MAYSFTEKKLIRKSFGKRPIVLRVPYLLAIQKDSYRQFLQADLPAEQRIDQGLQAAFKSVFPIESYNGNAALEFVSYRLGNPPLSVMSGISPMYTSCSLISRTDLVPVASSLSNTTSRTSARNGAA